MKHRSIGKMFLLTVVTLGIYRLYWFAKTRREMMSLNKNITIPPVIWLVAPILLMIASFIFFFATIGFEDSATNNSPSGIDIVALIVFYLSMIAVPLLMAIWLWKYSKAVEVVSKEKLSFAIALLILIAVPDGIDILIVQDTFNKMAAKQQSGPNPVTT